MLKWSCFRLVGSCTPFANADDADADAAVACMRESKYE